MRPRSIWGRAGWWLVMGFGVTLSAQAGTTLIIAWHFHRIYPIGLVAGTFYRRTCRALGQYYVGLGLTWFDLAAPCDAVCLCQSFYPLDLSGIDRVFRSVMDGVEDANAKFRFHSWFTSQSCFAVVHWVWVWMHRKQAMVIGLMQFWRSGFGTPLGANGAGC